MCISLPHVALKTEMCMRTCVVRVCVSRFPSSARHQSALNFSEVELRLAKTFFLIILLMHWNSTCPASLPPCFISCPIPCVPARFHACCLLIVCLRLSRVCTLEQYAPCAHRFGFFLSPPPHCATACLHFLAASLSGFDSRCWVVVNGVQHSSHVTQYVYSLFAVVAMMAGVGWGTYPDGGPTVRVALCA